MIKEKERENSEVSNIDKMATQHKQNTTVMLL